MDSLVALVDTDRTNAVASWALTSVLVAAAVWSVLAGAYLWAGFVAVVVAAVFLPSAIRGDWTVTVPWPHLLVVAAAAVARTLGIYAELAGYVSIATLAVLTVVELSSFTPVEMTRRFAVVFGVLTALALQAWLTIGRFYSDRWIGTDYLTSQTELQWDFVVVSLVALGLGIASEWYLARAGSDDAAGRTAPG